MPSASARRATSAERLQSIEGAATKLFAERGYAATTVDDIVASAGLTKPMLYRHFESKQELCVALLERYRAELIDAPLAQFTPGTDEPRSQLAPMLDAWLGWVERNPDATRLLFSPIGGDAEVERVQRELHARQAATQSALLRELAPQIPDAEAAPLGEAVRASLSAVALWWLDHPEVPREVPANSLFRVIGGTLAALDQPKIEGNRDARKRTSTRDK